MKSLVTLILVMLCSVTYAQSPRISAIQKSFSTGLSISINLDGGLEAFHSSDDILVDYSLGGRINKINDIKISYSLSGQVVEIGDVKLLYSLGGRLDKIGESKLTYSIGGSLHKFGNAKLSYSLEGRLKKITGKQPLSYRLLIKL